MFGINDSPNAAHQNVSVRYKLLFRGEELPKLSWNEEVEEAKWIPMMEVIKMAEDYPQEFAWNHAEIILDQLPWF